MGDLSGPIGPKKLAEITLPGSHDSGAYNFTAEKLDQYQSDGIRRVQAAAKALKQMAAMAWLTGLITDGVLAKSVGDWGRAQRINIGEQLNAGIRWLDLRTMIYPQPGGVPYLYHGFVAHTVSEALDQTKAFLDAQSKEIVVLSFSHMPSDMTGTQHAELASLIQTKLSSLICPSLSNLKSKSISELQALGQRAVVFYSDLFTGRPDWMLDENNFYQEIPCEAARVDDLVRKANQEITSYANRGGFFPVKVGFTTTPSKDDVANSIGNQFNPFSKKHDLRWFTEDVRESIDSWISSQESTQLGVVSTDFVEESNLVADCVKRNAYPLPPPSPNSHIRLMCSMNVLQANPDNTWSPMNMGFSATHGYAKLAGPTAHDIYAVGIGTIAHYDGSKWSQVFHEEAAGLRDIIAFTPTEVYAVGWKVDPSGGLVLHWDGATWKPISPPSLPGSYLYLESVWGTSGDDLYVGGTDATSKATVLHYDGTGWSQAWQGPQYNLSGLWGTDDNNIYAITASGPPLLGSIVHFDGTAWTEVVKGSNYMAIWGTSSSNVFAVGNSADRHGLISHFDGSAWSHWTSPEPESQFWGVGGSADNAVTVSGNHFTGSQFVSMVMRFDGATWAPQPASPENAWLYDIWEQ